MRPLKYTGIRQERYEIAKIFYKNDRIAMREVVAELNKEETTARKRSEREKEKRTRDRATREAEEFVRIRQEEARKEAEREALREAQRIKRNQARREKRKKQKLRAISWEQLEKWVEREITEDAPFTLTIRSTVAKVSKSFNFKGLMHFKNWMGAIDRQNVVQDSENYKTYAELVGERDVFSMIIPSISSVSGGCNYHGKERITKETAYYKLHLYNPITNHKNNCGFSLLEKITGLKLNYAELRKQYGVKYDEKLTPEIVNKLYRTLGQTNILVFIDEHFNEELKKEYTYVFIADNHYYLVVGGEYKNYADKKTKRGLLFWDIETRPTEEYVMVGSNKSYILKDTILCVYYKKYKATEYEKLTFRTTDKSSCRQFLDWLSSESNDGRFYNCIAHNGSRFDVYFLLSNLTQQEQLHTETQLRGYSIIGMQYKSHLFKDSCCFLTASLDSLCRAFKVKQAKLTEFEYNGDKLTNKNICFYKPELTFNQFMDLQVNEPKFWDLYEEYCIYDCIGLMNVWTSFKDQYDALMDTVFKYKPELKKNVDLMGTNTIGSLSKKILENTCLEKGDNGKYGKTKAYKKYLEFVSEDKKICPEKIQFINQFKRGGISHSNQPGKHNHSLISYDIASQYPASMMYMLIPCGKSEWTDKYNKMMHGFYHLKNLVFDTPYKFKPVASKNEKNVLVWNNDSIDDIYLDSFMVSYLKEHYGLKSFEVVKGLISTSYVVGKDIFGNYVDTLYNEKKAQDKYKCDDDERYNPALRECIKLFLNSLSGKLVEDPSRYFKLKYVVDSKLKLNGVDAEKVEDEEKYNAWVVAGVMVYSYSKRLLFEYVRCLPNNSDDVIHIETDSIYYNKKHQEEFVKNVASYKQPKLGHYAVKIGADLGNVKVEKDTTDISYFLGKKFYCIGDLYKIKGIPLKTIDAYGNDVELVNTELYEKIYNGETVVKEFYTMKKALFADRTYISSHKMSRTVNPAMQYSEYN